MSCPFRNVHGFAIDCKKPVVSTVVVLNGASFPRAILRAVTSVIIKPLKCVFCGLFVPLNDTAKKGHGIIAAILIGILGLKVFGNPLTH